MCQIQLSYFCIKSLSKLNNGSLITCQAKQEETGKVETNTIKVIIVNKILSV